MFGVLLAVRTRTPVLPMFIYRESVGRHRFVIHPPLSTSTSSDSERDVAALTQRCAATIEAAIGVAPEQWLWVHDRWRTQPASPTGVGP